ncbi:small ribosomal subunit Rsm22 family protein [Streptomyces sp. RFCAC02]|uniref:small ribosomal subunit Rsm22 family protein n=1 Tax=Streptomyces sp. RFCAC02 TaxID=2499143 RepID=UPI0010222813|nr:small ribosomal subunit Rsm22 family protein [Streptomyces sp. RFCAC02]
MTALPDDLRSALDDALRGLDRQGLARSVERLSGRYREGRAASAPILATAGDVAAYAGYRMPATYAAVHAALSEVALAAPAFAPRAMTDVGGGTGAALWAAHGVWPGLDSLTVVEQAPEAIALGRRLATAASAPALRSATWRRGLIDPAAPLPPADLVTLSYVLGELPEPAREAAVSHLADAAGATGTVVLVEPGTPDGYERIAAARDVLIARGLTVVAPCPHDHACPVPRGRDWCHFAARLPREDAHRRIKEGTLGFEDEKFSYVAASAVPHGRAGARVLRHPLKRKGLVGLRTCTADDGLAEVTVTKRQGDLYRAARDTRWGDAWPPPGDRG